MRTCRWVIAILTLVASGCGFDTSGLGSPPIADASVASDIDAGADADLDAPIATNAPDASVTAAIDASPPDANPPDAAPPCGHLGQACCAPDNRCALGLCLNDICVSLSR